jgi:hypothetical protein
MIMNAVFDETGMYRYLLSREWDTTLPKVLFIMLNPSTASQETEDQTSRQCLHFAKKFGFGSLEIVNLFALISTDPTKLKDSIDPLGKENDRYIVEAAKRADKIIVAWGEKHFINRRNKKVTDYLTNQGYDLYCLGVAKSGHPRHPSRMSHRIETLQIYQSSIMV